MSESYTWCGSFGDFSLLLPSKAVDAMAAPGPVDDAVAYWAERIARPGRCNPYIVRAILREYGAWDSTELSEDARNWQRLLWIAACDIRENPADYAAS